MPDFEKYNRLKGIIKNDGNIVIAYSGGADSTLLLKAAIEVSESISSGKVTAVFVNSIFINFQEREMALNTVREMPVDFKEIFVDVVSNKEIISNKTDRCYHCKKLIMETIIKAFPNMILLEGSNTDDLLEYRPGKKAIEELGIKSPLIEAGLAKKEILELLEYFDFPQAKIHSTACLATRICENTEITGQALKMVETAENIMTREGFTGHRVRHHGKYAKIEFKDKKQRYINKDVLNKIKSIGFEYIETL